MRYIGNKSKLLNEIDSLLEEKQLKTAGLTFCDAFSGTATVSNFYNGFYKIIANDFLSFAYEYSAGLLLNKKVKFSGLDVDPFHYFENVDTAEYIQGFCYNNFSPNGNCRYFSDENAKKIDFIRDTIDIWYNNGQITIEEKSYLIACLLEAVSKVSNVAGVYSAHLKIWDPRALKPLILLPLEKTKTRYKNKVYCEDIGSLISKISGDVLYLDPPYTPTQYNSQYHVLETIARNDRPRTHGVGKHRDNDRMSNWCKRGYVEYEFEKLIKECKFKHIILSYSDKGIMSPTFIKAVLTRYGKPGTLVFKKINFVKYKSTRAVNKELLENTEKEPHYEYLFYIEKSDSPKYISPLNYIGGKFDSLELLTSNFPTKINTFYDLFGGGGTVSLNVQAKKIVFNDINPYVTDLLKYLSETHPVQIYNEVLKYKKKYCLQKGNKDSYTALRNDYNKNRQNILLYLLICYGFEHQVRFNSSHEFNNPCGNSGFNDKMYEKIISFYLRCNEINITFEHRTYSDFSKRIRKGSFVYLDPPYLGSNGAYQDGKRGFNGWDIEQENGLHKFIESLNSRQIKFMFSNYVEHSNGSSNQLTAWCSEHNFTQIVDKKIIKRNRQNRREVIIINY